ncbi:MULTISPECIES: hypothetical protein [unclassified Bradyrhizobium]|uniref:hypothetical protein n=1 Tax=unclassified Bradyrhizobium TaxID=2631580 RepID=UPI002915E881|nr:MULTISPECIES: hypothetical protein [unclassified Bradyrhizobium]
MSKLIEYLSAIAPFWQFWVAVAFFVERALDRYLPTLISAKLNEIMPAGSRRLLFVWIAAIAFCYANFRAWDVERAAKEVALASQAKLNPFKIYQDGFEVGDVGEPKIDAGNQTLVFPTLATIRLDPNREIEYSNWKILCALDEKNLNSISGTPAGPTRVYAGILCRIEGHR